MKYSLTFLSLARVPNAMFGSALDECEQPDQTDDPPGDAAEAWLVNTGRCGETPVGEPGTEDQERRSETEAGPQPERDVPMVELAPVNDRGDAQERGEQRDRQESGLHDVPARMRSTRKKK